MTDEVYDELKADERKTIDDNSQHNLDILESPEIIFNTITQGLHRGNWYFGKLFKRGDKNFCEGLVWGKKILLNEKKIETNERGKQVVVDDNQIKNFGLNYKHQLEPIMNVWSNDKSDFSIKKFIESKKKMLDTDYFYNQIRNRIEYFMDVKDKRIYDLATCWVIGTYCYELFETYGYLYFRAMRDSGKSKFKKILRLIGFNGQEASSITEASFFRTIENTKGLLCLDEYEKMDSDRKKATDLLLNAGIEQGASVKRYDVDLKMNLDFGVYCPKIICNITGLNPTTMSRCIVVNLLRTTTKKGKLKPKVRDPEWQHIRDMCYVFVMENWRELKKIYDNYDYSEINNRAEDLWRPILSIGSFFGEKIEDSLKGYCEYITKEIQEEEISDSLHYIILSQLVEEFKQNPSPRFMTTKEITRIVERHPEFSVGDKNPEKVVAWRFRELKEYFKHSRSPTGLKGWTMGLKDILNAMASRNFPLPEWVLDKKL
ncbi:MAG: DUF3631 domain-containing protein [Nanoarchaeota archaeon]|nr:DUF3631 domain-containing protein [Nanoarchaeota archaeon]